VLPIDKVFSLLLKNKEEITKKHLSRFNRKSPEHFIPTTIKLIATGKQEAGKVVLPLKVLPSTLAGRNLNF
jgi:hypothetical protein